MTALRVVSINLEQSSSANGVPGNKTGKIRRSRPLYPADRRVPVGRAIVISYLEYRHGSQAKVDQKSNIPPKIMTGTFLLSPPASRLARMVSGGETAIMNHSMYRLICAFAALGALIGWVIPPFLA